MPASEALRRAWLATQYRVRLPRGGYAAIRIGAPLPAALRPLLVAEDEPWGFITAWNPRAQARGRAANRAAQRALLQALRERGARLRAGTGVGADGWREPSLFALGIDFDALDALAARFEQAAIVRGRGGGRAELREYV
ncbi:hypothetical protein MBSD_n2558 [Mizugakiibacter sediminis]|uniref:DUF3293 domain-containing protein n=1 Tax=Mizugakiibacter sediminis TaxID=1475481 RepID=A0A0K8QRG3_9GAMM|nr:DUF3293 domain-containing protein [Mizugakiibacter sediminis]GAP67241.1 hypothetical protein MBSD_n2558 [Mizugakiibacter sediminis]